jgi:hypothetical protein
MIMVMMMMMVVVVVVVMLMMTIIINLETITGQYSIHCLPTNKQTNKQKTAVLGTSHMRKCCNLRPSLKPECWGSPLVQEDKYQGKENM